MKATCCLAVLALSLGIVLMAKARAEGRLEAQSSKSSAPKSSAPRDNPSTPEKVALGKQLFFDPRLSGDNRMSCASCHLPDRAFADGLRTSKGAGGKELSRNTPSLLNVASYTAYFWDGRAATLEEQALFPIQSADEMNQDLDALEKELNAIPGYVVQFEVVFGSRVTRGYIARALAAFERSLVSGNSPFDRYMNGDKNALSDEARQGWELFRGDAGCIRCHSGPNFSDSKFYRIGTSFRDSGRGGITREKGDLYAFRTPGLRDLARTGPYMHDGSFETLEQVVLFYYRGLPIQGPDGAPLDLAPLVGQSYSEMPAVVAFLEALNGEIPQISPPTLP